MKFERIQILRFVAAFCVVVFHSLGTTGKYFEGPSALEVFHHGDLGVDLFFVISGFIIYLTVQSREHDWKLFLRRRLERIVPLYWLVTLAMAALMLVPGGSSSGGVSATLFFQSLFYVAWTTRDMPVVYPGWSLEYEMLFYALVATTMAWTTRMWSTSLLILAFACSIGLVARIGGVDSAAIAFLTDPMLLEFAMGVLVAEWVLTRRVDPLAATAIGLMLVLIALLPGTDRTWRVLAAGIPGALLVTGAALLDQRKAITGRVTRLFVRLGDASYSIYLVQVFTISILCKIFQRVLPAAPRDAMIVLISLATVAVAYAVHRLVERPLGRWLRNGMPSPIFRRAAAAE